MLIKLLAELFITKRRKARRSNDHKTPFVWATMVAALGLPYIRLNSPKEPCPSYVRTCALGPFGVVATKTSNLPVERRIRGKGRATCESMWWKVLQQHVEIRPKSTVQRFLQTSLQQVPSNIPSTSSIKQSLQPFLGANFPPQTVPSYLRRPRKIYRRRRPVQ